MVGDLSIEAVYGTVSTNLTVTLTGLAVGLPGSGVKVTRPVPKHGSRREEGMDCGVR
jgi:hypothetical protein